MVPRKYADNTGLAHTASEIRVLETYVVDSLIEQHWLHELVVTMYIHRFIPFLIPFPIAVQRLETSVQLMVTAGFSLSSIFAS